MKSSKRYGSRVQLNHLKDGDITYYIVYKIGKETKYKKVGRKSEGITEAKAISLRNQILSDQRHGIDLSQKNSKHLTFDTLAETYFMSNKAHNKSNHKSQLMYKKHIKYSFGDVTIAMLDDSLITELQSLKRADGLSDNTNNQIVKLVKRIIGFGINRGIILYSPFKNIRLLKVDDTRLRYLSKNEITKLTAAVEDHKILKLFVKFALSTGARAKSVLSIQKKDINLESRTITLHDFKRNTTYLGYLDQEDFEIVEGHIKYFNANSYVVSLAGKEVKYQNIYADLTEIFSEFNDELTKKDRANRVVIHTLRHTFASHLAIAGVSIQEIQKLMNHADIKQTLKYAKLSPNSGRIHVENLYKEVA